MYHVRGFSVGWLLMDLPSYSNSNAHCIGGCWSPLKLHVPANHIIYRRNIPVMVSYSRTKGVLNDKRAWTKIATVSMLDA